MELPFKLENGIYLENDNLVLEWWSDKNKLLGIGNPLISYTDSEIYGITWKNKKVFDNKNWNISVVFNQLNPNGVLERIEFKKSEIKNGEESKELYNEYSNMFKNYLGEPKDYSIFQWAGEPMDVWYNSGVKIMVGLDVSWGDYVFKFGIEKLKPNTV